MTDEVKPERTVLEWSKRPTNLVNRWEATDDSRGLRAPSYVIVESAGRFGVAMGGSVTLTFLPSFDAAKALAQSLQDALDGFTYEAGIAEGKRLAIEALKKLEIAVDKRNAQCYPDERDYPQSIAEEAIEVVEAIVSNEHSATKEGE